MEHSHSWLTCALGLPALKNAAEQLRYNTGMLSAVKILLLVQTW